MLDTCGSTQIVLKFPQLYVYIDYIFGPGDRNVNCTTMA
jgi:hypothetical protein